MKYVVKQSKMPGYWVVHNTERNISSGIRKTREGAEALAAKLNCAKEVQKIVNSLKNHTA